jgi:hypothetical protein
VFGLEQTLRLWESVAERTSDGADDRVKDRPGHPWAQGTTVKKVPVNRGDFLAEQHTGTT